MASAQGAEYKLAVCLQLPKESTFCLIPAKQAYTGSPQYNVQIHSYIFDVFTYASDPVSRIQTLSLTCFLWVTSRQAIACA